ncbi:MAG: leucine-rich repeat domain-containing protein [Bacteroidales bacterium]|nr:leucine-rich repeat domain-containing protein [Bacteroidales bacterium]
MKKLLLFLTIMAVGIANAWSQQVGDYFTVSHIKYRITSLNPKTVEVVRLTVDESGILSLNYPDGVNYNSQNYLITAIGDGAFEGQSAITEIQLPESVTSIGNNAFKGCTSLATMYRGSNSRTAGRANLSSIATIGDGAFKGCAFTQVTCASASSIGNKTFQGCTSLTSASFTSATAIGDMAFQGCTSLAGITIPSHVTSIGVDAFQNCKSITSLTIPSSVTSIGRGAFSGCRNITGSLSIPNSVTSIGDSAFYSCSHITSVSIPTGITSIGNAVFNRDSSITSITIPNNVTSIGNAAFQNCMALASVTIPSSVTSIGNSAFENCAVLTGVTIPGSVTSIGNYAFYKCTGLTSMTIPSSVTSIGNYAFCLCTGLTSVTIPSSVTSIGNYAFYQCTGLTSMTIPNSVRTIGNRAFYECTGLTSVTIPSSVTSIGDEAFRNCRNITGSLTIPGSVISIGNYAFFSCKGITSLTISDGVRTIGEKAFSECTGLTSNLTIPSSVTLINTGAFSYCSGITNVTVAQGNTTYDSRDGCNAIIETSTNKLISGFPTTAIPSSVTAIGDNAFAGCNSTSITIPNSVTSIGSTAFLKSTITHITIPGSVTSIGNNAFQLCSRLTSVTILEGLTSIGGQAFHSCSSIRSIIIPSSVTSIGSNAFFACNYLSIFNLTGDSISGGKRDIHCTRSGSGKNTIYKMPEDLVIADPGSSTDPRKLYENDIPTAYNFIYKKNGSWRSKKIVLTDSRTENNVFACDVDFVADTVVYDRSFDDDRSSTLCLPFEITSAMRNVAGHKFKMYSFDSYTASNGNATFNELGTSTSAANTPYIIAYNPGAKGTFQMPTFTNVNFGATTMADVEHDGFHFTGTYTQKTMDNQGGYDYYGLYNGYFVHSRGDATVMPFRSYFYTFNAPAGNPAPNGIELSEGGDNVGIELVDEESSSIVFSNDVYDLNGRIVRKNAESLNGLPKGIYIWRGKKLMNWK